MPFFKSFSRIDVKYCIDGKGFKPFLYIFSKQAKIDINISIACFGGEYEETY